MAATEKKILRVLDALTIMPESSPEALRPESIEPRNKIKSIIESKNVLAVGISEKISHRKKTGNLALIFYVEKKIPLNKLKENEKIPARMPAGISATSDVLTDVVAIGKLRPEVNATRKTFQPGNSIGHIKVQAGTFGAVVKDKKNKLFILSNSHVLANAGTGKVGDIILYPGVFDNGRKPVDVRARLHRFIPFKTANNFQNVVDCAIAEPLDGHLPNMMSEIKGLGVPKGTIKAKRGMKVVKVGRTTGKTSSEITDVNFRAMLDYEKKGLRDVRFKDQIFCKKRYTLPGDSGSLVIDKATGKAVGLHFAGAEGGSVCNPINEVLNALEVALVTGSLPKLKEKKVVNKKSK